MLLKLTSSSFILKPSPRPLKIYSSCTLVSCVLDNFTVVSCSTALNNKRGSRSLNGVLSKSKYSLILHSLILQPRQRSTTLCRSSNGILQKTSQRTFVEVAVEAAMSLSLSFSHSPFLDTP